MDAGPAGPPSQAPARARRTSCGTSRYEVSAKHPKDLRLHETTRDINESHNLILAREAAQAFFECDIDGDRALSLEEFAQIAPCAQRMPPEELRRLFDLVDTNHDGEISADEFFLWVLSTMASTDAHASFGHLANIFAKYDRTGDGRLDASELANATESFGFGSMTGAIFAELDADGSGTIDYQELIERLKARSGYYCSTAISRRFLCALAMQGEQSRLVLRVSDWQLTTAGVDELRAQIVSLLAAHRPPASGNDLFRVMSGDYRRTLNRSTLRMALELVGFPKSGASSAESDERLLDALWMAMDGDSSGVVGATELIGWLNCSTQRRQRALKLSLRTGDAAVLLYDRFSAEGWTAEGLRRTLQAALIHSGLAPVDLFRAWGRERSSGDQLKQFLGRRAFLGMMEQIVADEDLWRAQLQPVAQEMLAALTGEDQVVGNERIDIVRFQAWLGKGWWDSTRGSDLSPPSGSGSGSGGGGGADPQSQARSEGRDDNCARPMAHKEMPTATTTQQQQKRSRQRSHRLRPRAESVERRSTLASVVMRNPDGLDGEWNAWLAKRKRWTDLQARKQYQYRKACALTVTAVDASRKPFRPPPPPPPILPESLSPWVFSGPAQPQALPTPPYSPAPQLVTAVHASISDSSRQGPKHVNEHSTRRVTNEAVSQPTIGNARPHRHSPVREVQTSSAAVRACMQSIAHLSVSSSASPLDWRNCFAAPHSSHRSGSAGRSSVSWVANLRVPPRNAGAPRTRPAWDERW